MAIVRINDSLFTDPAIRPFINTRLKNLRCLTDDPTVPVKEYYYDSKDFEKDELVEIEFQRSIKGVVSIKDIRPILNSEDNIPTISLLEVHDRINPQNTDKSLYVQRTTMFTEYVIANGVNYGLSQMPMHSNRQTIESYMSQARIKSTRIDPFIEGFKIFITPNHKNAPWEQPETEKKYLVQQGKAAGNTFWTTNHATRMDWFNRILETDNESLAIKTCSIQKKLQKNK